MKKQEIIYLGLNNWFAGDDYPDAEPFTTWFDDDCKLKFMDENWVKENKLCVLLNLVDMSINFRITTTKEWVEKNCPELLTKYTKFIYIPNDIGEVYDKFGLNFAEYSEENIGIKHTKDY